MRDFLVSLGIWHVEIVSFQLAALIASSKLAILEWLEMCTGTRERFSGQRSRTALPTEINTTARKGKVSYLFVGWLPKVSLMAFLLRKATCGETVLLLKRLFLRKYLL